MISIQAAEIKTGGRRLLGPVNLDLSEGAGLVMLLGANGAGKSLLLRLIHGLETADGGRVLVPTHQAMVFQTPIFLNRSVRANLSWAFRKAGNRRRDRDAALTRAIQQAGLAGQEDQNALALSGGEAQRLALARACGCNPSLLLLDEPTAALDPAARKMIQQQVRALADAGLPVLMSSHSLAEARSLADHILFMADGRIVEQADAATFFDAPQSDEAKLYLAGEGQG